ncbi:MAG: hypothetical protein AB1Z23_07840 [Eubacteriales bacterium]
MENKCWFCGENDAAENTGYEVRLKKHDDKKDVIKVKIPICTECAKTQKKGDLFSTFMYLIVLALAAVAILVFKIEWFYVGLVYILLTRALSSFSVQIRNKLSEPNKSVCVVSENPDVLAKLEEGYVETRRF